MDWRSLARGALLYGVVAAGLTVAVVALVTSSEFALLALMLGGLVCLLFAFGVSDVRTNQIGTEAQHARVDASYREKLATDRIMACYGVGLAVFSFVGMTIVGG